MRKVVITLLVALTGALFVSTSTPASADAPEEKAAEAGKRGQAKTEHVKAEGKKADHAARESAKAEHAKGKATKAEAAKRLSPSEREDQLHASTMKTYEAKKEKAQAANNEKLVAQMDKQISKENARHEQRIKQLSAKSEARAKAEAKQETPAKAPAEADAPKAPAETTKP